MNLIVMRKIVYLGSFLFLAFGCGGGATSNKLDFNSQLVVPSLAMVNRVASLPATPSGSMPNGAFTYNGYAGFGAGSISSLSEVDHISKMTMVANFQTDTFSGSMSQLTSDLTVADNMSATYGGTINMSGSISGNTFNGVHSGVWTMNSTDGYIERPYNGVVSGLFGGSGATGIAGASSSTFNGANVTGLIVGER